jgi:hypothetical protein
VIGDRAVEGVVWCGVVVVWCACRHHRNRPAVIKKESVDDDDLPIIIAIVSYAI